MTIHFRYNNFHYKWATFS